MSLESLINKNIDFDEFVKSLRIKSYLLPITKIRSIQKMQTEKPDFFSQPSWPKHEESKIKQEDQQDDSSRKSNMMQKIDQYEIKLLNFNFNKQIKLQSYNKSSEEQDIIQNSLTIKSSFSYNLANLNHESKKCKYNILSRQQKKKLIEQTKKKSIAQVARQYGISVNNLCRWKKSCERRIGAGRKVTNIAMEKQLINWIVMTTCTYKMPTRKQIQEKAKLYSSDCQKDFKASKGWFERFMKRNANIFQQCNSSIKIQQN